MRTIGVEIANGEWIGTVIPITLPDLFDGITAQQTIQVQRVVAEAERNNEPQWMTDWRLQAYERWLEMKEPDWAMVDYTKIDFQDQYYYARPKSMVEKPKSLDEVDPKLLATYEKLGIPVREQEVLEGVFQG